VTVTGESSDPKVLSSHANEDHAQSAQNIRLCLQLVVVANGGGSLAMLSALTTLTTAQKTNAVISIESVQHWFAYAGSIFLVGVFLALLSGFFFSVSRENWGHFWEDVATTGNQNYQDKYALRGERYARVGFRAMCLSVITFLPGAVAAVKPFLL
jgi:hypothetical protein